VKKYFALVDATGFKGAYRWCEKMEDKNRDGRMD